MSQTQSRSTLLFGLGATKSGTSWLYDYLYNHPQCSFSMIKELHFFDAIDLDQTYDNHHANMVAGLRQRVQTARARLEVSQQGGGALRDEIRQAKLLIDVLNAKDTGAYLRFLDMTGQGRPVMGDLTPCYSLLSADRLRAMSQMAERVKFIYVMRDPIERLWSHVRMTAVRRSNNGKDLEKRAGKILGRVFSNVENHIGDRGDYAGSLTRIQEALPADDVFVTTTEALFDQRCLDDLCAFLGISRKAGNFAGIVNQGVAIQASDAQIEAMASYLMPQYAAAEAFFGKMPEGWCAKGRNLKAP